RVYIPQDALARHGTSVDALAEPKASPALRNCLREVVERTAVLLREAEHFSTQVNDLRLGLEIAVIYRVAQVLTQRLLRRDPRSERVHLSKTEFAAVGIGGAVEGLLRRAGRWMGAGRHSAQDA